MTADSREKFWQECFAAAARAGLPENEINSYSAHGWQARQEAFSRRLRRLLAAGDVAAGERAIDVGCGSGAYCRIMHAFGLDVTGTDLCRDSLEYATAHSPGAIRFLHANCLNLPFPDDSFGLAVSVGVLQHVSDTPGFLREHVRILRPGGVLLLMTLNRHTVLEAMRRIAPACNRRRRLAAPEVRLRRFSRRELYDGVLREAPGARMDVSPVFVFPRSMARAEGLAARLGTVANLAGPLAVDLLVTVKLPGNR